MKKKSGTRHEVMSGIAKMTGGGLRKKDLKINNKGKIVSKKLSKIAKERNNLQIGGGNTIQFNISDRSKSLNFFLKLSIEFKSSFLFFKTLLCLDAHAPILLSYPLVLK